MTDYAVLVKHPGFVDRFVNLTVPPDDIGGEIWWSTKDDETDMLVFKNRPSAEACKSRYEMEFTVKEGTIIKVCDTSNA